MRLPDLRPWASLLLADSALLWLLQGTLGTLLPGGLPGLWLEGTLRLGGLWWLLKLGGLLGFVGTLLPLLCLLTPLFLSLRALVPGAWSAPPVRVASAPWSWLLLGYGAAGLSGAVWAVLSPPGAQDGEQGQENNKALMWRLLKLSRPDLPFLAAAFVFLVIAVWGETLIPYYSGRVIDILGGDFDPEAFASAIFFMCLFSFGRRLQDPYLHVQLQSCNPVGSLTFPVDKPLSSHSTSPELQVHPMPTWWLPLPVPLPETISVLGSTQQHCDAFLTFTTGSVIFIFKMCLLWLLSRLSHYDQQSPNFHHFMSDYVPTAF